MKKLKFIRLAAFAFVARSATAASTVGGLTTANTTMQTISTAIYTLVGTAAAIILLFVGIQVWLDKKQWSDFFETVAKVAVVGGVPVLAVWAWGVFSS